MPFETHHEHGNEVDVDDDDEVWTTIPPRNRKDKCKYTSVNNKHKTTLALALALPRPDAEATVPSLHKAYTRNLQIFRQSSSRQALKNLLHGPLFHSQDHNDEDRPLRIDTAVCLASGSFSRDNLENRRRSLIQLAAFLGVVEVLQAWKEGGLVVVAQDPVYTTVDEAFSPWSGRGGCGMQ